MVKIAKDKITYMVKNLIFLQYRCGTLTIYSIFMSPVSWAKLYQLLKGKMKTCYFLEPVKSVNRQ